MSKWDPGNVQNELQFYNKLKKVAYKIFGTDGKGFTNMLGLPKLRKNETRYW